MSTSTDPIKTDPPTGTGEPTGQRRSRRRRSRSGNGPGEDTQPAVGTPPKLRRRPALVALAVVLIAVGALLAAYLVARVGETDSVIGVRNDVQRGQVVGQDDLMVVSISPDPALRTVPGTELGSAVGQYAAYDLVPGTILTPESVTEESIPGLQESVVGIALLPSQMPARPLRAGDPVRIVATPRPQGDLGSGDPPAITATVLSAGASAESSRVVVDVAVRTDQAGVLAALVATGRVALVADGQEVPQDENPFAGTGSEQDPGTGDDPAEPTQDDPEEEEG